MKKRILSTLFGAALFVTAALSFQNAEALQHATMRTASVAINTPSGQISYQCCEPGNNSCNMANCSSMNINIEIKVE